MVEDFINSIGGYNSWQFAALSLGCYLAGFALYCWHLIFLPVPIAGIVLLFYYWVNTISSTQIADVFLYSIAGIIPILFLSCCLLFLLIIYMKKSKRSINAYKRIKE